MIIKPSADFLDEQVILFKYLSRDCDNLIARKNNGRTEFMVPGKMLDIEFRTFTDDNFVDEEAAIDFSEFVRAISTDNMGVWVETLGGGVRVVHLAEDEWPDRPELGNPDWRDVQEYKTRGVVE